MKKISLLVLFITFLGCKEEYSYKNKIKEDVAFLADDTLEGRETGTKGEQAAAAYIVERFKELGLQPKGTEGYYQSFSFKQKRGPHEEEDYTNAVENLTIIETNGLHLINIKAENTI